MILFMKKITSTGEEFGIKVNVHKSKVIRVSKVERRNDRTG